jgi:hypothetical protein
MTKVNLKKFIRNFVNRIPKDRDREKPLFSMAFESPGTPSGYSSSIYVYAIESLKVIRYRYSTEPSDTKNNHWSIPDEDYEVVSLTPPKAPHRVLVDRNPKDNIWELRVRYVR